MAETRQASLWESLKLEAQSAFSSIGDAYQQVLLTGHVSPSDRTNLNREIAEASYKTPEQEAAPERERSEPEQSSPEIEPEM